jgi:hypothetical protein
MTDQIDHKIVKAAIYPPIGVMRVGNSKHEYFIGPLVDEPEIKSDPYAYRDKTGAIKRQAAQFRIYGLNKEGVAIKELTMDHDDVDITWHCALANQKSSWYQFQIALDIPDAQDPSIPPSLLRNIDVKDRNDLYINGGSQSVSKPNVKEGHSFVGHFFKKEVYLGEMKTDEKGRLIMLGGHGVSANVDGNIAVTFANNEGWHDDMSDGPVTADVSYKGKTLTVDPAWVICAPPDYAPMQKSVRTMWDLMRSVAHEAKMLKVPKKPSFTKDILPIFERMTNLQWVNAGFAAAFGWGGQFDYTSLEWVQKLNDPSEANLEMRRTISNNFRRFDQPGATAPQLWPWLYGDAVAIPSQGSPRQHATLSKLQLKYLDKWVEGKFHADFKGFDDSKPKTIDEYPIAEQPDMLTKAAMDFCLADAFHPGCEMTWPMRNSGMYMAPFRLKHAPKKPKTDYLYYGSTLDSGVLSMSSGPILGGQVPGSITRWMAVPWQTDTASCRDGYTKTYDPYLPTFWPARVPNNILGEDDYEMTINPNVNIEDRRLAFSNRYFWLDDLPLDGEKPTQTNQINAMVKYFDKLAIVQHRKGTKDAPEYFPPEMQVGIIPTPEQEAALVEEASAELNAILNSKRSMGDNEQKLLTMTIDTLAEENLFDEKLLMNSTKEQLLELVSDSIKGNYQEIPAVQKLLSLIASKEHQESGMKIQDYYEQERNEVGIQEQLIRFQRFNPRNVH